MVDRRRWFDRRFVLGLPSDAFPDVLERVRGTPARIEELLQDVRGDVMTRRVDGAWSVQENVGHLLDLEALWLGRLEDLTSGLDELRPADLENRKTHEAAHNEREIKELSAEFRRARESIVEKLESLSDDQIRRTAMHPRLKQPMTVVDLFFFVAEHDDHHLARITQILRAQV